MKKKFLLFLVMGMIVGAIPTFAQSSNNELHPTKKDELELVTILREQGELDSDSINSIIDDYLNVNNKRTSIANERVANSAIIIEKPSPKNFSLSSRNGKISVNNGNVYEIDSKNTVIFTEMGYHIISDEAELNEEILRDTTKSIMHSATRSGTRRLFDVDKTWTHKSWSGYKIFKVKLKGYFNLEGGNIKPKCTYGSFTPTLTSYWDVQTWSFDDDDDRDLIYTAGSAVKNSDIGLEINWDSCDIMATATCEENDYSFVLGYNMDVDYD
ncbi:MAG: hypothetical protein JXO44_06050 [Clostridia bacterium]|nr:hypothetical protein [Clostridia bacterium]